MRVSFRIELGFVRFDATEAGLDGRRAVGETDVSGFESWRTEYRELVAEEGKGADLLRLGRQMYAWLDGGERWLEQLLSKAQGGLIVEFQGPATPDEAESAFLQAPWELLASEAGHLAADHLRRYCPVRRLGAPTRPVDPSDYRLGLTFMAASPRGASELNYEAEEDAILTATGSIGVDLEVEESGNADLLAERLAEALDPQVLHLSCHGRSEPAPILLLEDQEGDPDPTEAAVLVEALQHNLPPLLFLSACQTASPGILADPLVMSAIQAGFQSVMGWDGSVYDAEATAFTETLYRDLSRRGTLEEAIGAARRGLLTANSDRPSRDWHLARLWLGSAGGGPLVSGRNRKRRMLARDHGYKAFLDKRKQQSPVASREAFVGRRRELQTSLRVLREDEKAGLLIHGMGRLGKSSLAARLTYRRQDLAPVVVFDAYDALSVADAIREACPPAAPLIEGARGGLADAPGALEGLLRQVLEGPCQQAGDGRQPILLVIDDLERILEDPAPGGRHRVRADYVPVLRAILRAFDPGRTESRLLLTSRYRFTLPDNGIELEDRLYPLHLPPMNEAGARKQALRRIQAAEAAGAETGEPHHELLQHCILVAGGNPGLQDLLFDLAIQAPGEAEAALAAMEAYLARGDLPEQEAINDFLENLAIERLVALLSDEEKALLRAATVFELPVPLPVLESLGQAVGGDLERLMGLGLVDSFEDMVRPPDPAGAVSSLARPHAGKLDENANQTFAGVVLNELFAHWGGTEGGDQRPYPADIELTRLALAARDAQVVAACAPDALLALNQQFRYRAAADIAQRAMALIEEAGVTPSIALLRRAGEVCARVGKPETARRWFGQALQALEEVPGTESPVMTGGLLLSHGNLLRSDGHIDQALACFERARSLFHDNALEREEAIALGEIAQIRAQKGEVDEAVRMHQEALKVYERLDDVRERAISLSQIAQIRAGKGEVDEALRIHQEALKVYERIGEVRERAATLGQIAQIRAGKGEVDEALRIHQEALEVYERLGDVRERAVTLGQIAQIRTRKGELDEALRMHQEELEVYERLGEVRERGVTLGDIARITADRGEVDEALSLHEERLEINRKLGDLDGQAATLWDIARIELGRNDVGRATPLIDKAYRLFDQIGRLEGICGIGVTHGQLLVAAGRRDEGLAVLRRSEAGYRQLQRPDEADQVADLIRQFEGG